MAKTINSYITGPSDLVTSREKTRSGFISMALEKNYLAQPYILEAKSLKALAGKVSNPMDLLKEGDIRVGLLTASGLSDKALNYLTEDDKTIAIQGLIEEFLVPAGGDFVDELVYRYLLTKGDALGGKARNLAGALGERKYIRCMISVLNLRGEEFFWFDGDSKTWLKEPYDTSGIEKRVKGLSWKNDKGSRVMLTNLGVPFVKKNVDLVLLNGELASGKLNTQISKEAVNYIALGELKGGIDPAGADEHWKTANSALGRVKSGFSALDLNPHTFFVGAAIENAMAGEIYNQMESGHLSNAANLLNDEQLTELCNWLLKL